MEGGKIHVLAPGEFEDDEGKLFAGDGLDSPDAGYGGDDLFDGLGDDAFHFFGNGVGVGRSDGEFRVGKIRQKVDGELAQGYGTQEQYAQVEHDDSDGAFYDEIGEMHGFLRFFWLMKVRLIDARYKMLDPRYSMLDAGYSMLDA